MSGAAGPVSGTLHQWVGDRFVSNDYDDVVRDAEQMTLGLRRAGVKPGTRVATILTNTPLAVRGILGTWLAGGALASLPVPARGMGIEEYVDQVRALCARLEPAALLVDEAMLGLLPDDLRKRWRVRTWERMEDSGRVEPSPPGDDDIAFIQFSSGSTSMPKGCSLTPRAIAEQLGIVRGFLNAEPGEDTHVSWLPLSHDMGLFGNLLAPWSYRYNLVLSSPERFMFSARSWFTDISEFGGTLSCGTNTGLHLAATRTTSLPKPLKLRSVVLGSERLEWETVQRAVKAFEPYGLEAGHLMPAYGLAEATLAVTTTPQLESPRYLSVDGLALADGAVDEVEEDHPTATRIVAAGVPCDGVELPGLPDDKLGEIRIRSRCLAQGYWADEERTAERFRDGELYTGDLAFAQDGYLYPVGRMDDVISVGGRKVYAREIEAAVDALDGVRKGCSTVVETSGDGGRRLTLLVELKDGTGDYDALATEAARLAMQKAAVTLGDCRFLEKGALPKTPSGKIQRYRCRQMLDAGLVEPMATVDLS